MAGIQVVAEGEVPAGVIPEPTPAAETPAVHAGPQSPLALLRGKREELRAKLYLDLAVPRWQVAGRQVWVRYAPGSPSGLSTNADRFKAADKPGGSDWQIRANADVLVKACIAVYDLAIGEKPSEGDLVGDFPNFGSESLADALGTANNAIDTCIATYLTEADLLLATSQLLDWSGQVSKKADEDFLDS
jgi:hypothetical protein